MPLSRSKMVQCVMSMWKGEGRVREGKRRGKRGASQAGYMEFLESRWLFSDSAISVGHTDLYKFIQSDFAGTETSIKFVTLPTNGTFTWNGTAVANQTITLSALGTSRSNLTATQLLVYNPPADGSYTGPDQITWEGLDANGTVISTSNISINVTDAHQPVVTDVSVSTTLGSAYVFSSNVLSSSGNNTPGYSDADGVLDSLHKVKIASLPQHGNLTLGNATVTVSEEISASNLTSLKYTPSAGYLGTDSFEWNGSDGAEYAANIANVTITVSPAASNVSETLTEGTPFTLPLADFTQKFAAANSNATLASIQIATLPANGTLTFNGTAVTANETLSTTGNFTLIFIPKSGFSGTDTFTWEGSADGTVFSAAGNVTLTVAAPTATSFSLSVIEGTPIAVPASDFTGNFSFSPVVANAPLAVVKVVSLPAHGALQLAGVNVTANQTIAASALSGLVYIPAGGYLGDDTFTWSGSANGVDFTSAVTGTLTMTALTVSDVPTTQDVSGLSTTFHVSDFANATTWSNATISNPGLQKIKVVFLPTHGTLTLNGAAVTKDQEISVSDLANLTYTSDAGYVGVDAFNWTGSNGFSYATVPALAGLAVNNVFGITGNGTPIVNGETKPSMTDFTDYGSMTLTPDASMLPATLATRTYTVKNSGTGAMTLANLTVSGANAGDFRIISALSSTTLQAGQTATFTVQFVPTAAGKRTATISLNSNIGPFTFAVQGMGVVTTTVPTTAAGAGGIVQVATTKAGSGAGATNGQIMYMTYTGYLADGTVFDSSFTNGLTGGLALRLDNDFADGQPYLRKDQTDPYPDGRQNVDGGLIAGWEYGLQGIKAGEKRVFVINSAAGYGTSGNGKIPGGATLIFEVQCLKILQQPQLVVGGNGYIAPGSITPNSSDGTVLTIPSGASSVTSNFTLATVGTVTANGAALSSWKLKTIRVNGDRKDFALSLPSSSSLSVTFHPLSKGNKFLTITVNTTDPVHPHYKFKIEGVTTDGTFVDLATGFSTIHVPKQGIVSGSSQTVRVPVLIGSASNQVIPAGSKTNVQVYAAPVGDTNDADKVLLGVQNVNVGGMAPNGRRRAVLAVTLPQSLATGTYDFVTVVNSATALGNNTIPSNIALSTVANEVGSSDNTATSSATVAVTQGTYALSGAITADTVAAANGSITGGGIVLDLKNAGNIPFTKDQTFGIALVVHPSSRSATDPSGDVVVGTATIGTLGLNGSRKVTLNAAFNLTGFDAGVYLLEAKVVPNPAITLTNGANPIFNTTASGLPVTLTIS